MTTVGAPEEVFLLRREALLGVAYRMLGSIADAEDVVSETDLPCSPADRPDGGGPGSARRDDGHAVSPGLLTTRERLTPVDRSVYVLREALDDLHAQIAGLLKLSPANVRQIHRRARARYGRPPRFVVDRFVHDGLLPQFLPGSATDELEPLAWLLAHDATMAPLDTTSRLCA